MPLTLQSPLKCAYRCIIDTNAAQRRETATRIIGIEVAAVGIGIQLLCMWNSLNPFDTSNRDLVNFFFVWAHWWWRWDAAFMQKEKAGIPLLDFLASCQFPGFSFFLFSKTSLRHNK